MASQSSRKTNLCQYKSLSAHVFMRKIASILSSKYSCLVSSQGPTRRNVEENGFQRTASMTNGDTFGFMHLVENRLLAVSGMDAAPTVYLYAQSTSVPQHGFAWLCSQPTEPCRWSLHHRWYETHKGSQAPHGSRSCVYFVKQSRFLIMEHPNLIAVLYPHQSSPGAIAAIVAPENASLHVPFHKEPASSLWSEEPTWDPEESNKPSLNQIDREVLQLTFNHRPKGNEGFCLGRDKSKCDIFLPPKI